MNYKINSETIKSAVKCKKNFSCLNGNNPTFCSIVCNVSDKIHFVKSKKICVYQNSFGGSVFCGCPVRKEIYNKYKI